uniref:Secreted phosphoprotein 24 n=1 Tax=Panthera tigris altaica TaxID=74533 RepID=A0A8C9JNV3_PANTA
KMVTKILILLVLGMNFLSCAGKQLSPRKVWDPLMSVPLSVYVLDQDSLSMDLEFGIRETTCRRESGEDPSTCDFQRGYYMVIVCRSTVQMSAEQVRDVWVRCHWSSSSESNSSEEMGFGDILGSSTWRNMYLFGNLSVLLSAESPRRIFPPGNRGYPYKGRRTRTNAGFE